MPKGNIYYAELTISYRSGRSKDRKKAKVRTTFVGYDFDDACDRIKSDNDKLSSALIAGTYLTKVRDVRFIRGEMLHEAGKTMYDIDTLKVT